MGTSRNAYEIYLNVAAELGPTKFIIVVDDSDKPRAIQDCNWIKNGEIHMIGGVGFIGPVPIVMLMHRSPDWPFVGYKASRFLPFHFSNN
jgi:3-polyprenyl-4-hydroxybenzoate decarboxylase